MIKVLIADDHTIFREGVKRLFVGTSDIEIAGEAKDGFEALTKLKQGTWDVILLDINMPNKSGLDILRRIKSEGIKTPVIMLSMYPEDQYALRAFKAGASGYITKDSESDELIAAIRKVAAGGRYATPELMEKLLQELERSKYEKPPHLMLSEREYQIFNLIVDGKSLTEIGEVLSLSVKTVSTYRSRILEKMHLKNNAELIHYALQNQLRD